MSQVIHNAQHDFWSPPIVQEPAATALVEACDGCGAEFMVGARFCHVCGFARRSQAGAFSEYSWSRNLRFLRVLDIQNVQHWLGLSLAPLAAFIVGIGCLVVAALLGLVYSVQTFQDFQAIQFWRIQWILGSVAAFVAGILLKRRHGLDKE